MQRLSAILVLVLVGLSLIPPSLTADANSNLPACCRKDGKHHCSSMSTAGVQDDVAGAALSSVMAKCPLYVTGAVAPVAGKAGAPNSARVIFASLACHPAGLAQTEAHYRISFDRASQKRGPPSLLS